MSATIVTLLTEATFVPSEQRDDIATMSEDLYNARIHAGYQDTYAEAYRLLLAKLSEWGDAGLSLTPTTLSFVLAANA